MNAKNNTTGVEKHNKISVFNVNCFLKTLNTLKDSKLDTFPITNCDLLGLKGLTKQNCFVKKLCEFYRAKFPQCHQTKQV